MTFLSKNTPSRFIFLIDTLIVAFGVVTAFMLRFDFQFPDDNTRPLLLLVAIAVVVRGAGFLAFHIPTNIVRYTSTRDVVRIFYAILSGSLVFGMINVFTHTSHSYYLFPISIIAIEFFVTLVGIIGYRVLVKVAYLEIDNPNRQKREVIIYGAGNNGLITKRTLDRDAGVRFRVVALLDDDPGKQGKKMEGIPIFSPERLPRLLKEGNIAQVILSVPGIKPDRKQSIVNECLSHNIRVLTVPPASRWINGELSFKQIKKINIEDLLERDTIHMDAHRLKEDLSGKTVLVTGAAGSIGSEIVRQLLPLELAHLVLIDNAETPLHHLSLEMDKEKGPVNYTCILGDIRQKKQMASVFARFQPQVVYHAAAYKHVPLMEDNPAESVQTNITGTKVMADLALEYKVSRFIMISTDKAVRPGSVMGASKRIAEIYTQSMNALNSTRFIVTRFGNVLGSNGSVIPLFEKQIRNGGPITVTHPKVTRFFMTIPEACQLVLEASIMGNGGEVFMFDMGHSIKIEDLAKKMVKLSGLEPDKDIEIIYTGLRPGEKLFEELLNDKENTLPTHHPKIMIARVEDPVFERINEHVEALNKTAHAGDALAIVKQMESILPEFESQNPVYRTPS